MSFTVVEEIEQDECVNMDMSQSLDDVGLYQDGDVIIGALINIYNLPPTPDLSFTKRTEIKPCTE